MSVRSAGAGQADSGRGPGRDHTPQSGATVGPEDAGGDGFGDSKGDRESVCGIWSHLGCRDVERTGRDRGESGEASEVDVGGGVVEESSEEEEGP